MRDPLVAKVQWPLKVVDGATVWRGELSTRRPAPEGDLFGQVVAEGPIYDFDFTTGAAYRRNMLAEVLPMPEQPYRLGGDEYLISVAPTYGLVRTNTEPLGTYRAHGTNHYRDRPSNDERLRQYMLRFEANCQALSITLAKRGIATDIDAWKRRNFNYVWPERLLLAKHDIENAIPVGASYVLVNGDEWDEAFCPPGRQRAAACRTERRKLGAADRRQGSDRGTATNAAGNQSKLHRFLVDCELVARALRTIPQMASSEPPLCFGERAPHCVQASGPCSSLCSLRTSATMLSICTTVKNRSLVRINGCELRLFPNTVASMVRAVSAAPNIELVVADWQSDDWPLSTWLARAAKSMPCRVESMVGTFSRGRGLNAAANAARGNVLLFIDADVLINEAVVRRGLDMVDKNQAYFPILYAYNGPEHRSGRWMDSGFGNCMLSKSTFTAVGGWPEYNSWGAEDDDFYARVAAATAVTREPVEGFFHQWHPDDIDFKNQYGEETDGIREIRARKVQRALECKVLDRLRQTLPKNARCILVDDDRTDIRDGFDIPPIPFLEQLGKYWGPPHDDAQAISELERLHNDGARFVVFPWLAFWWLEHYPAWRAHLSSTGRCIFKDDVVVIYELSTGSNANSRS